MWRLWSRQAFPCRWCWLVFSLSLASCATPVKDGARPTSELLAPVDSLGDEVAALSPSVQRKEAREVAACAVSTSRKLALDYRVSGPALFQNFLVNVGMRERGLCYQWTEDLLAELQKLKLSSVELDWGVARAGTLREHNCVVVKAKKASFEEGLVLDPWRRGGRLFWTQVEDDHYPWRKDESRYARARLARATSARLGSERAMQTANSANGKSRALAGATSR